MHVRSFTTISFVCPGFSGSGYEACTSQNVPPRSAQMRIDLSGMVDILPDRFLVQFTKISSEQMLAAGLLCDP